MASSWGDAWASAWGDSWGEMAVETQQDSRGARRRRESEDELHQIVRDKWEAIEAAKAAPVEAARPMVARVPKSAPPARTAIHDGAELSEHDMLALLIAVEHLDD